METHEARAIFGNASFRFGHSLVRGNYRLRKFMGKEHKFFDLLELFQGGKQDKRIEKHRTIDWSMFFELPGGPEVQNASPIDTGISTFMSNIPEKVGHNPGVHIILSNLKAGINAGLAPGLSYAKELKESGNIDIELLDITAIEKASFRNVDGVSIDELPLWLYILLEAQLHGHRKHLGKLGGLLNAQVLRDAIKGAKYSVFENNSYHFENVIGQLGEFGELLMDVKKEFDRRESTDKNLKMTHLITLLNEHDSN